MTHKATFKPSQSKRPLARRFTPLAWALVGVVALVMVLTLIGSLAACSGQPTDEPWQPTPTSTVPPTATEVLPTATPTEWYEGMLSPTPHPTAMPTPAFPAWWEMTQDANGQWWPPDEVSQAAEQGFDEAEAAYRRYLIETTPPDWEGYLAALPTYRTGDELVVHSGYIEATLMGVEANTTFVSGEWESCIAVLQDWSTDGSECTLGQSCMNGAAYEYDSVTGELIRAEAKDASGLILWRLRYDPYDGRWKLARFIQWIPPE